MGTKCIVFMFIGRIFCQSFDQRAFQTDIVLHSITNSHPFNKMNSANRNKQTGMKYATRSSKRKIHPSNTMTKKKSLYNMTNYAKFKHGKSGIKFMKTINVSKPNFEKAEQFYDSLRDIPMYVIWAHSCVCPNEGYCYGEMPKRTEFAIPTDTYVVNLAQPGDYFCGNFETITENVRNIRPYLSLHSEAEIYGSYFIGDTKHSMFSGIQRATSPAVGDSQAPVLYPNLSFTFNASGKKAKPTDNENGVYSLPFSGKPNNSKSILPQDYRRRNWYLEDIIQEVYEKTNTRKGIFLIAGCLNPCNLTKEMSELDHAAGLMHIANARYPTLRETFTHDEMKEHIGVNPMFDVGVSNPTTSVSTEEIQYMTKQCLTCPKRILEEVPELLHTNNYEEIKSMANTFGPTNM